MLVQQLHEQPAIAVALGLAVHFVVDLAHVGIEALDGQHDFVGIVEQQLIVLVDQGEPQRFAHADERDDDDQQHGGRVPGAEAKAERAGERS